MIQERRIWIEGTEYRLLISDEPQALLAAQAAGRAVLGVEDPAAEKWTMRGIPYVVPGWEEITEELEEMVLRRRLGFPWIIAASDRLTIREFVKADAGQIPVEECTLEEEHFRSEEAMEQYIRNQYAFYEYGIWALVEKEDSKLIGMAGVTAPGEKIFRNFKLEPLPFQEQWLELGYHIFEPYRGKGYAKEAAAMVRSYAHDVLSARLIAVIHEKNQASRAVAESLKMKLIPERDPGCAAAILPQNGTDTQWQNEHLLYGECCLSLPDREDS